MAGRKVGEGYFIRRPNGETTCRRVDCRSIEFDFRKMAQHVIFLIKGHLSQPCAKTYTFQIRWLAGVGWNYPYVTYRTYDVVIVDDASRSGGKRPHS